MNAFTVWSRSFTTAALLVLAAGSPVPASADPEDEDLTRDRQEIRQDDRELRKGRM